MTRQFTITTKLKLGFTALVALIFVLGGLFLTATYRMRTELEQAVNQTPRKLESAIQISADVANMRASQRGMVLYASMSKPDVAAGDHDKLVKYSAAARATIGVFGALSLTAREREMYEGMKRDIEDYIRVGPVAWTLSEHADYAGALREMQTNARPPANRLEKTSQHLVDMERAEFVRMRDRANGIVTRSEWQAGTSLERLPPLLPACCSGPLAGSAGSSPPPPPISTTASST